MRGNGGEATHFCSWLVTGVCHRNSCLVRQIDFVHHETEKRSVSGRGLFTAFFCSSSFSLNTYFVAILPPPTNVGAVARWPFPRPAARACAHYWTSLKLFFNTWFRLQQSGGSSRRRCHQHEVKRDRFYPPSCFPFKLSQPGCSLYFCPETLNSVTVPPSNRFNMSPMNNENIFPHTFSCMCCFFPPHFAKFL